MFNFKKKRIFLDYASATPVRKEVERVMAPYQREEFYNPMAIYAEGERVKQKLESLKEELAETLGVNKSGIIFTSGGTEANVLALRGLHPAHVVVSEDSHPSVLDALKGVSVSLWKKGEPLPLRDDTTVVSSTSTDNKLGRMIREERRKRGGKFPLLHIDASQTMQYWDMGLEKLSADLITLDAGKFYGPKGVGALVVRRGVELDLPPRGTPAVPLIVGLLEALKLAKKDREQEFARLSTLSGRLYKEIKDSVPQAEVWVEEPNIVNVSLLGILPELLVLALEREGVLVSAGSACNSMKLEPPETPIRFSLGRETTEREILETAKIFCRVAKMW